MDGGAWQSGVFDNGRDVHHGLAAAAPAGGDPKAPVPGVPAATRMYNPPASTGGKDGAHMTILSLAFRSACILFSVIAFAVIASNEGSADYGGENVNSWKAINSSNLAYLLAIDVIVCAYSIVQLVLSLMNLCTAKPVLAGATTPASTITYGLDQALTYMLMARCGAGASRAASSQKGEAGSLACGDGFRVFCDKNAAAVTGKKPVSQRGQLGLVPSCFC